MDFGYDIEYIKYKDWQKKLLTELNKRKYRDTLYPLLAVFPEVLFSEEESELTLPDFDFTNCTRALEGESIICPEISFELISKYISAFIKKGYLEEPGKLNANRK